MGLAEANAHFVLAAHQFKQGDEVIDMEKFHYYMGLAELSAGIGQYLDPQLNAILSEMNEIIGAVQDGSL